MRISDWSSDLCSTDLIVATRPGGGGTQRPAVHRRRQRAEVDPAAELDAADARVGHVARLEHHQPGIVEADEGERLDEVLVAVVVGGQTGEEDRKSVV